MKQGIGFINNSFRTTMAFKLLIDLFMVLWCLSWSVPVVEAERQKVRIAAILPNDNSRMFSITKSSPAIQIGIERVQKLNILPNHDLSVKYADSKCSVKEGPLAAFNFYVDKEADIFFGPVCDYALAPVARYAYDPWDIPIISTGGFAHDFTVKSTDITNIDTFPTLTRVHLTFDSLGEFITTTLKNYKWRSIKVVYQTDGHSSVAYRFCYLAISALVKRLREKEAQHLDYHLYLHSRNSKDSDKVFQEIGTKYAGKTSNAFTQTVGLRL